MHAYQTCLNQTPPTQASEAFTQLLTGAGGFVGATSNGCNAKSSNKRFKSAAFKADFVKTFGTVHAMFVELRTKSASVTSSTCGYTPQTTCCACVDTYNTCMSGCRFIKTGFYTSGCKSDVSSRLLKRRGARPQNCCHRLSSNTRTYPPSLSSCDHHSAATKETTAWPPTRACPARVFGKGMARRVCRGPPGPLFSSAPPGRHHV